MRRELRLILDVASAYVAVSFVFVRDLRDIIVFSVGVVSWNAQAHCGMFKWFIERSVVSSNSASTFQSLGSVRTSYELVGS